MKLFKTDGTILDKNFRQEHPNWPKQIAMFCALIFALLFGLQVAGNYIESQLDSPRARTVKTALNLLAEQLESAQKVGDKQAVIALLDPTTKIVNEYNTLDAAKRAEVNNSPLRYCLLAAINLSDGVSEVINSGYWTSKDKYQNALDMCR